MVCAISWVHTIALRAGLSVFLQNLQARRSLLPQALFACLLISLEEMMHHSPDVCTLAICLLSFAGFLCFDEMANLKESDVSVFADHAELYIESSKMDQYRDGAWVVIDRTQSDLCPVAMLECYMKLAQIERSIEKHLFQGLTVSKNGAKLHPSGGLSHTRESWYWRSWARLVWISLSSVSIAYILRVHLPLLMRVYQTDGSRGMVDGEAKVLRMAILRIVGGQTPSFSKFRSLVSSCYM